MRTADEATAIVEECMNKLLSLAEERDEVFVFVYAVRGADTDPTAATVGLEVFGMKDRLLELLSLAMKAVLDKNNIQGELQ
jgi:hypothetical protein